MDPKRLTRFLDQDYLRPPEQSELFSRSSASVSPGHRRRNAAPPSHSRVFVVVLLAQGPPAEYLRSLTRPFHSAPLHSAPLPCVVLRCVAARRAAACACSLSFPFVADGLVLCACSEVCDFKGQTL